MSNDNFVSFYARAMRMPHLQFGSSFLDFFEQMMMEEDDGDDACSQDGNEL